MARRTEYVCDICNKAIPRGKPVLAFEFDAACESRRDYDVFDWTFSAPDKMERHWCERCLRGMEKMVPRAMGTLKTIVGH